MTDYTHAYGPTPNGCWLVGARLVGISDISPIFGDIETGEILTLDPATVPGRREFERRGKHEPPRHF